jgi:hypothetical protein
MTFWRFARTQASGKRQQRLAGEWVRHSEALDVEGERLTHKLAALAICLLIALSYQSFLTLKMEAR